MLVGNSSSINSIALDDFVNDHDDQAAFALQLLAKVCESVDDDLVFFRLKPIRFFSLLENRIVIKKPANVIESL